MSIAHVTVDTTPAQITAIPGGLSGAVVLNSGQTNVVVDNRDDVSLNPQSGIRLKPGELMTFSAFDGESLQLFAVAAGDGGQLTLRLPG